MIDMNKYTEFATEKACELLAIDSPTGFTAGAVRYVKEEFEALGFSATVTVKGEYNSKAYTETVEITVTDEVVTVEFVTA